MSLDFVNTLATCATFVVISATAIAAIVQLRQLRASNQIVAFNELRQAYENPHLSAAHKYIDTQLARDLEDQHSATPLPIGSREPKKRMVR